MSEAGQVLQRGQPPLSLLGTIDTGHGLGTLNLMIGCVVALRGSGPTSGPSRVAGGGDAQELSWSFAEVGELSFACGLPGHADAGPIAAITST